MCIAYSAVAAENGVGTWNKEEKAAEKWDAVPSPTGVTWTVSCQRPRNTHLLQVFPHSWDCWVTAWRYSQSMLRALHGQSQHPAFPPLFIAKLHQISYPTGIFPVLISSQKQILPFFHVPSVPSSTRCPCCLLRKVRVCQGKAERKLDSGLWWPAAHPGFVPDSGRRELERPVLPQNEKSLREENLKYIHFLCPVFFLCFISFQICHYLKRSFSVLESVPQVVLINLNCYLWCLLSFT